MKIILIFTFLGLSRLVPGQELNEIKIDTLRRTSEFYVDEYVIAEELFGKFWKLESNYDLRIGSWDDTGPKRKGSKSGKWSINFDTLIFNIEKKVDHTLKFKVVTFSWTINTVDTTNNNKPMALKIFWNVLIDDMSIDPTRLRDELVDLIRLSGQFSKDSSPKDYFSQLEKIDHLVMPIRKFFSARNVFHGMRFYLNGNLVNYF